MSYANETGFSKIFSKVKTYVNSKISSAHTNILKDVYPIGSIYMSANNTNPGDLFGGTWEQLQDKFLIGAGNKYTVNSTGGEVSHKLTSSELPKVSGSITMHSAATSTNIHAVGGSFSSGHTNSNTYKDGGNQASGAPSIGVINLNFGGDIAHNNMPPYLSVYMWKRTA